MKLKILSFNGENFHWDDIISITVMTALWEITVLDNHESLITAIRPTTLEILQRTENIANKKTEFALWSGLIEINNNDVKIMTDMLVDSDSVNIDEVEAARKKALATMEKYKDAKDRVDMEKFIEAEDQLLKYVAQIKLHKLEK